MSSHSFFSRLFVCSLVSSVSFLYFKVENLWDFLVPLLRKALSAVNVETLEDWGTCMATAVVSLCYYGPNDLSYIDSKMLIISALVGNMS